MKRLTIKLDPDFERDLRKYMEQQNISSKSEAIRQAVHKAVGNRVGTSASSDFRHWLGLGLKAPLRRERRFFSEDDLWSKTL